MSLRARVAMVTAVAITGAVLLSTIALAQLTREDALDRVDAALVQQSRVLEGAAVRLVTRDALGGVLGPERPAPPVAAAALADADLLASVEIQVAGRAVVDVGDGPPLTSQTPDGTATVDHRGESWRVQVATVGPDDEPRAEAVARTAVALPLADVDEAVRDVVERSVTLGLLSVLAASAAAWWLAGRATRPIVALTETADRVAGSLDLTARVEGDAGSTEVDVLARAMNRMLGRVQASTDDRERALEASRAFAAGAAHELRTPLTSVVANLDLLADHPELPVQERTARAEAARREAIRLRDTLEALNELAVASASDAPRSSVDLADVVDVVLARTGTAPVDADLPDGPVLVRGDAHALGLLVDNLVRNARIHGDGTPRVAVRLVDGADGPEAHLVVEDDGGGFGPEPERLLAQFVRGEGRAPGSGLGLAIVAQVTRMHGGWVELGEAESGGARVRVVLPAA